MLAVEGIAAFVHVSQDRDEARAERLIEVQQKLGSIIWLRTGYRIYRKLLLSTESLHSLGDFLVWKKEESGNGIAQYQVGTADGKTVRVPIDIEDELFRDMNRVIETYHRIGQLCERGFVHEPDFINFQYVPVIRHWRRLRGLVMGERDRRCSPHLWRYFEYLAEAAERKLAVPPIGGGMDREAGKP